MKVSQLLFLALFAIVGSAIAQDDEAHEQVNCDAVCVSKVEDTWTQANREIRAANEKLEHASEQVNARDNEINELRGEIRGLRDNLGAVEGAVNDGRVALATAQEEDARALTTAQEQGARTLSTSQEEGARALGAQSRKAAAAEGKLATMQVELDAAKAEAAEFASSRFLVNVNVIQKDFKHFLKKLGLIKSDECCDL
jgi:chromosome segregation ATPase